mmetsp:Transcript_10954/g.26981  ORF Transcript_10954/g.26981 Transcript_10954/m.26981 type:complete len:211 (-) Transcript_10954:1097-1729(-)
MNRKKYTEKVTPICLAKLRRDSFLHPFQFKEDLAMRSSSDKGSPKNFLHISDLNIEPRPRPSKCLTTSHELGSGCRRWSIIDSNDAYEWIIESLRGSSSTCSTSGLPSSPQWPSTLSSFLGPQGSIGTKGLRLLALEDLRQSCSASTVSTPSSQPRYLHSAKKSLCSDSGNGLPATISIPKRTFALNASRVAAISSWFMGIPLFSTSQHG